jgi:hypothetical protein
MFYFKSAYAIKSFCTFHFNLPYCPLRSEKTDLKMSFQAQQQQENHEEYDSWHQEDEEYNSQQQEDYHSDDDYDDPYFDYDDENDRFTSRANVPLTAVLEFIDAIPSSISENTMRIINRVSSYPRQVLVEASLCQTREARKECKKIEQEIERAIRNEEQSVCNELAVKITDAIGNINNCLFGTPEIATTILSFVYGTTAFSFVHVNRSTLLNARALYWSNPYIHKDTSHFTISYPETSFVAGGASMWFAQRFNRPILELPPDVETLTLGSAFNSRLEGADSVKNLKIIGFTGEQESHLYDRKMVGNCRVTLLQVRYHKCTYQNTSTDPETRAQFTPAAFNQPLTLPSNLEELDLSYCGSFNHPFHSFPPSLEKIRLGASYSHSLDHLPDSVKELCLHPESPRIPFTKLPRSLTTLHITHYSHEFAIRGNTLKFVKDILRMAPGLENLTIYI